MRDPKNAIPWVRFRLATARRIAAGRRLYSHFIARGDLVFDIGANHGLKTQTFLALGAKVVAFEPQHACREVLGARFATDGLIIDPRALSHHEGTAVLRVPQASTLASMNPSWVAAVKASGRFPDHEWTAEEEVTTTRLETAIAEYGEPAFCKIDVEGNEEAVVRGLERPLKALSLEFVPEYSDGLIRAVTRLSHLGSYEWNFVRLADDGTERSSFDLSQWMATAAFLAFLAAYVGDTPGDVYARLQA